MNSTLKPSKEIISNIMCPSCCLSQQSIKPVLKAI